MDLRRASLEGNLLEYIKAFGNAHVLVIGDAMLDCYLEGRTDRLCREAPVPVVSVNTQTSAPGGAANTAANVASLGGRVSLLSVIGDDADANLLGQGLEEHGIPLDHILRDPARRTLAKRRILASGQMLVRYDEGNTELVTGQSEQWLLDHLAELYPVCDVVIISDYGYGILTPRVVQALGALQQDSPRILVVDAKNLLKYRFLGPTAVKPNYLEATQMLGIPKIQGACARADQIFTHRDMILEMTGAQVAAVTLDSEGALVFGRDELPYRTYVEPQPDFHAAGAGDTFVSALALALAVGADVPAVAELASAAAAAVVAREGTTTCSARELWEHFAVGTKVITAPQYLAEVLAPMRQDCQRVVFTNGCFDILHRGHITYLNQAKERGDILVVAVNSDDSVRRLKGPTRPINNLDDRVNVLSALSCVDFIVPFDTDTPVDLIRTIHPDVYVKGGDYTVETLPEAPIVKELGGTVEILPYIEDRSTTGLIQRIRGVYAQ